MQYLSCYRGDDTGVDKDYDSNYNYNYDDADNDADLNSYDPGPLLLFTLAPALATLLAGAGLLAGKQGVNRFTLCKVCTVQTVSTVCIVCTVQTV